MCVNNTFYLVYKVIIKYTGNVLLGEQEHDSIQMSLSDC
jgi:hypothetical protein